MKTRFLSRDAIKLIAMLTMLLNHIATVFLPSGTFLCELFTDVGYFRPSRCATSSWKATGVHAPRSAMRCGWACLR